MSSMANADVGYLSRLRDIVHTILPESMALRLTPAGVARYVDPELRGKFRFSIGVGSDIGAWTPDVEATLSANVVEKSELLRVNRIPIWIEVGDIITLGPSTYHEVVAVDRANKTLRIAGAAQVDLEAPHPVFLYAKRCVQNGVMPNPTTVVLDSSTQILVGDEIIQVTVPGVLGAYASRDAVTVFEANPGQFEIELESALTSDPGDGSVWYLRANPAYISDVLIIPGSQNIGPVYFDLASKSLVDTTRVRGERISLSLFNANELLLLSFPDVKRNQFVSTFPLRADSFLFGRRLGGSFQFDENGAVHLIAGSRGYGSSLVNFPAPLRLTDMRWLVPVKANAAGTFRARFRGGEWQNFPLLANVASTVTVEFDSAESQQLEVVWAGANGSKCVMGSWYPSTRRARLFQYTHLVKLTGARWMTTGAILKPALLSFNDLRSSRPLPDSGQIL